MRRRLLAISAVFSLVLCIAAISAWCSTRPRVCSISIRQRQYTLVPWNGRLRLSRAELIWPPPIDPGSPLVHSRHTLVNIHCVYPTALALILPSYWCWRRLLRAKQSWRAAKELGLVPGVSLPALLHPYLPWWLKATLVILWFASVGLAVGLFVCVLGPYEVGDEAGHWIGSVFVISFVAALIVGCWARIRFNRVQRRVAEQLCVFCGYDLRATSDRCPECGTPVPEGHVVRVGNLSDRPTPSKPPIRLLLTLAILVASIHGGVVTVLIQGQVSHVVAQAVVCVLVLPCIAVAVMLDALGLLPNSSHLLLAGIALPLNSLLYGLTIVLLIYRRRTRRSARIP